MLRKIIPLSLIVIISVLVSCQPNLATRHTTLRGEDWESIAKDYGVDPAYLQNQNPLYMDSILHPEMVVTIPKSYNMTLQPYINFSQYMGNADVSGKNMSVKIENRFNTFSIGGVYFGLVGYANMSDAYRTNGQYSLNRHDNYGAGAFMDYRISNSILKLTGTYVSSKMEQEQPGLIDEISASLVRIELEHIWRTSKIPVNKKLTIYGNIPLNTGSPQTFNNEPLTFMNNDQIGFDFEALFLVPALNSWNFGLGGIVGGSQYSPPGFGDINSMKAGGIFTVTNDYQTVFTVEFGRRIAYRNSSFNSLYLSVRYEAGPDDLAYFWDILKYYLSSDEKGGE